jgi:hypothetical protein
MKKLIVGLAAGALALVAGAVAAIETADDALAYRGGPGRSVGHSMARSPARSVARHVNVRRTSVTRHVSVSRTSVTRHVHVRPPNIGIRKTVTVHNPGGLKAGPAILRNGPRVVNPTGPVVITTGPGVIRTGPGVLRTGPGVIPTGPDAPAAVIPRATRIYRDEAPPAQPPAPAVAATPPSDPPPPDPPRRPRASPPPPDDAIPPVTTLSPGPRQRIPMPCPGIKVALASYTSDLNALKVTLAKIANDVTITRQTRDQRLLAATSDTERAEINAGYMRDLAALAAQSLEQRQEQQVLETIIETLTQQSFTNCQ